MPLIPLYDKIVVRLEVKAQTTASGIVIASNREQRSDQGEVIAVGQGHFLQDGTIVPLTVKAGDIVQFNPQSGQDMVVDGEQLRVFQEAEIIGIIR
jgi:chaperonin GroES